MTLGHDWPLPDTDGHWQEQGACKTRLDLNWFPGRGEATSEQKTVCAGCPVRIDCLAWALDKGAHEDFGIWGGTSERQRRILRQKRTKRAVVG